MYVEKHLKCVCIHTHYTCMFVHGLKSESVYIAEDDECVFGITNQALQGKCNMKHITKLKYLVPLF